MPEHDAYTAERVLLLQAFGVRLRAARERRELSQEALARRANVHRTHVHALERGRREPGLTTLLILADALAVAPADLFGGLPVPQERKPATHSKAGRTEAEASGAVFAPDFSRTAA
jgi:transcriptional regulator with XRE-family HTH domain